MPFPYSNASSTVRTGNSMLCSLNRSRRGHLSIGNNFPVHAQMFEAFPRRPLRHIGVHTFSRDNQRREQLLP